MMMGRLKLFIISLFLPLFFSCSNQDVSQFSRLPEVGEATVRAGDIPAGIDTVTFMVSAAGHSPIEKTVEAAAGGRMEETFTVSPGTTYRFTVRAFEENGLLFYEGEASEHIAEKRVTVEIPMADCTPAGLEATGGTEAVSLSWNAVSGASSYTIYWRENEGVTLSDDTITGVTVTQYEHQGLTGGTTVYYLVTAMKGEYETGASSMVSAAVAEAAPPPSYTVTYNGNGADGGTVPVDNNTYQNAETVTVLGNTGSLTLAGYTFDGWNTSDDGSGTPYAPGADFTMGSANVTLYAQWVVSKQWVRTYGGAENDTVYSVVQTPDNGFIVAGGTSSFGDINGDGWLVKLSVDGAIDWERAYSSSQTDTLQSAKPTADGGYIIGGYTQVDLSGTTNQKVWFYKVDSSGALQWEFVVDDSLNNNIYGLRVTSDDGCIFAGKISSQELWVVKCDSSGAIEWQKQFSSGNFDSAYAVAECSIGGGYVVAGETSGFGAGSSDVWVLKLDDSGTVEWEQCYGGSGSDIGRGVVETSDGGFLVAGSTASFGAGSDDLWLLKLASDGSLEYQKAYGGTGGEASFFNVTNPIETSDGNYLVGCRTASFGSGSTSGWLLKVDTTLTVIWDKVYGGSASNTFNSLLERSDGGYVVTGFTSSFGAGGNEVWVLSLDENGGVNVIETLGLEITSSTLTVTNTSVTPTTTSAAPGTETAFTPIDPDMTEIATTATVERHAY